MDKYLYLDTNILSILTKDESNWDSMLDFLERENLILSIAGATITEISEAFKLHKKFVDLIWHLPTKFIRNWDEIIRQRISSGNLLENIEVALNHQIFSMYPIYEKENLILGLRGQSMRDIRENQKRDALLMAEKITTGKKTFLPTNSGKYTHAQAENYVKLITRQFLKQQNSQLIPLYERYGNRIDHFEAIETFAYFSFNKYYIASQKSSNKSDFGDLFHVFYMPFVDIAILERNMTEFLNIIQKKYGILKDVKIYNIDYYNEIINNNYV